MQSVWVIPLWAMSDQNQILVGSRLDSHSADARKSQECI